MIFRLIIVFLLLIGVSSPESTPLTQRIGDAGTVDWSNFMITSRGRASENPSLPLEVRRESALHAAERDALVRVMDLMNEIFLDAESLVGDVVTANDSVHLALMDTVSRYLRTVDRVYLSDGSTELDVELPLLGPVMGLLLPIMDGGQLLGGAPHATVFTGVVIDARGLELNPCLVPRLLNEDGVEVYGRSFVARESAVSTGMCGWMKESLDSPEDRVGASPIVIKAKQISGANRTDIIIANDDATAVHSSSSASTILRTCRLIVLN